MVMKRKRIPRKSLRRRRRVRRRMNIVRRPASMMKSVFHTKRITALGNWTFNTTTTDGYWRYFSVTMASYNNFAEMAALFDEYRVNAIKLTLRPRYDCVDSGSTVNNPQTYLHYIVDPGSTLLPAGAYDLTTLNTFLENNDCKTRTLNRPVSIYFKPKVMDQVAGGGTQARAVKGGWIRTTETSVIFRGAHLFIQGNNFTNVTNAVKLDQYITFYCSFRNPK